MDTNNIVEIHNCLRLAFAVKIRSVMRMLLI